MKKKYNILSIAELLSRKWDKLLIALTFDSYSTNWLAGEMNRQRLLSSTDFKDVRLKTSIGSREKAEILMASLKTKVDLNPEYLNVFIDILEMKPVQYFDALQHLQKGIRKSSDPGM